jgi:hypothetical protein
MTARRIGRGSISGEEALYLRRTWSIHTAGSSGNGNDRWYLRGSIMALLGRVFTTRTLVQIIFVLTAAVMMKAMSSHYDFSWASALAQG